MNTLTATWPGETTPASSSTLAWREEPRRASFVLRARTPSRRHRLSPEVEGSWWKFSSRDGAPLDGQVFLPPEGQGISRMLVAVHGVSRDVDEMIRLWAPLAARHRCLIVAPHFEEARHAGYQRLNRGADGLTADEALWRLLTWLDHEWRPLPARRILFGHSGGAQFAHRFLLARPHTFDAGLFSSAGWYTFPDIDEAYPYGVRGLPGKTSSADRLEAFLRVPMLVTVGENDDRPDPQLRSRPQLDPTQGSTRRERAHRWAAAMRHAAVGLGLKPRLELRELPDAGHPLAECFGAGLPQAVNQFLQGLPWIWSDAGRLALS